MNLDTFFQLLNNAELLVFLSVLYQIMQYYEEKLKRKLVYINGVFLGSIGVILMSIPVRLTNGTVFDTRSILISLIGLIFGFIPSIIAATMMVLYRIYLSGPGMLMGVMVILSSCFIGLYWRKIAKRIKIKNAWLSLYLFGIAVHIVMLACTLFLPNAIRNSTLQAILYPVLIIYPLATVVVGKLLQFQQELSENHKRISAAERKFHSIFDQAKIGIGYADLSGKFIDMNQMFSDMLGYSRDELKQMGMMNLVDQEDDQNEMDRITKLKRGEIPDFTIDKQLRMKDRTLLWVNLTVSLVEFEKDQENHIMYAIVDIDERKKADELMIYLTTHDQPTDMYNRIYFEEKLREIDVIENYPLAIILISVNGLKLINDAYGSKTGDILLKKVSKILKQTCAESAIQARISGNEFSIVYTEMDKERTIEIIQILRKSFLDESVEHIQISVSIGYALQDQQKIKIFETFKLAKDRLNKENLIDKTSMASRTIDIIMNSLFEKNSREMLHSKRVSQLSEFIATHLHLDETEVNKIKIAGLMHDIGKIGINDSILNKIGKLTLEEWEEVKRHSEVGYRILSSANEFSEIADYILSHHERWDGKGYPRGLKGEESHPYSRIITIADAFDAMTSERTYRKALSIREAIEEIKNNVGTQFDPHIAQVFIDALLEE